MHTSFELLQESSRWFVEHFAEVSEPRRLPVMRFTGANGAWPNKAEHESVEVQRYGAASFVLRVKSQMGSKAIWARGVRFGAIWVTE